MSLIFFTSCPGICPKMTNNLLTVQEFFRFDKEVLILSHSVTPEIDHVSRLKTYAGLNGIDQKKWHLVIRTKYMKWQENTTLLKRVMGIISRRRHLYIPKISF